MDTVHTQPERINRSAPDDTMYDSNREIHSMPDQWESSGDFQTPEAEETGEKLEYERELLDVGGDSDAENVYPMKTIKPERAFYTIFELKRKYEKRPPQIILDSSFQRNSVWRLQQKRELIESVLMGLPLPIFYFNRDKTGRLIVVDGRQRLTAFFEFMDEKKGFALDYLKILSDLNKKRFKDLDVSLQTKIEDYQIIAHVIPPSTPDKIKFDIFDRVNRAGTQLNKQEIRHALYQGNATDLLIELSRRPEFAQATDNAFVREVRMKDRYILLRFISFFLYYHGRLSSAAGGKPYQYAGDIDELLGISMDYLNSCPSKELNQIRGVTIKGLNRASFYLSPNAFRLTRTKADGAVQRYPININIFETFMLGMEALPDNSNLGQTLVRERFYGLKNSAEFRNTLMNNRDSGVKVSQRRQMLDRLLVELGVLQTEIGALQEHRIPDSAALGKY